MAKLDAYGKLTSLTELYLSYCELNSFPEEILQVTSLTTLYLAGNNLTSIPAEIGKLTLLTDLNLGANKLTSLPVEIGKLTLLTNLKLYSNPELSELPWSLGNIPGLPYLDSEGTKITRLTKDIIFKLSKKVKKNGALEILMDLQKFGKQKRKVKIDNKCRICLKKILSEDERNQLSSFNAYRKKNGNIVLEPHKLREE